VEERLKPGMNKKKNPSWRDGQILTKEDIKTGWKLVHSADENYRYSVCLMLGCSCKYSDDKNNIYNSHIYEEYPVCEYVWKERKVDRGPLTIFNEYQRAVDFVELHAEWFDNGEYRILPVAYIQSKDKFIWITHNGGKYSRNLVHLPRGTVLADALCFIDPTDGLDLLDLSFWSLCRFLRKESTSLKSILRRRTVHMKIKLSEIKKFPSLSEVADWMEVDGKDEIDVGETLEDWAASGDQTKIENAENIVAIFDNVGMYNLIKGVVNKGRFLYQLSFFGAGGVIKEFMEDNRGALDDGDICQGFHAAVTGKQSHIVQFYMIRKDFSEVVLNNDYLDYLSEAAFSNEMSMVNYLLKKLKMYRGLDKMEEAVERLKKTVGWSWRKKRHLNETLIRFRYSTY